MRQWMLDGSRSGMENLWSAATFAANLFRHKAVRSGLDLLSDEWTEILDEVCLVAVRRFLNKLKNGKYSRKHSFYLNVRSCVWSVFYAQVELYLRTVVKPKIASVDRLTEEQAEWILENVRPCHYISKQGNFNERKVAQKNLKLWESRSVNETFCSHEDAADFWSYLEACEDLGIPVRKETPLYRRGRWLQ